MYQRNLTLLTDLYELTMMQGYFKEKYANETVVFDAFYRSNPDGSAYSICAGLEQVADYIKNLHLTGIFLIICSILNFRAISMPFRRERLYFPANR